VPIDGRGLRSYVDVWMFAAPAAPDPDDRGLAVMHEAWAHWRENLSLPEARWARAYQSSRGLPDIRAGLAVARGDDLTRHLARRGYTTEEMGRAGLVAPSRFGGTRDRFRDRIVLPLYDRRGHVVGVTARANPRAAHGPKYLNSPNSEVFDKSRVLYGLTPEAAARLADPGWAVPVVVEGPFDAAAVRAASRAKPHPSLPDLVPVAPCGTALTRAQVALLADVTGGLPQVVFAFDADGPGQRATVRAVESLLTPAQRADAQFADVRDGKDPADWLRRLGPEALYERLFAAPSYSHRMVDRLAGLAGAEPYLEQRLPLWRAAVAVLGGLDFPAAAEGREHLAARLGGFHERASILAEADLTVAGLAPFAAPRSVPAPPPAPMVTACVQPAGAGL
jgi:DNA primase